MQIYSPLFRPYEADYTFLPFKETNTGFPAPQHRIGTTDKLCQATKREK